MVGIRYNTSQRWFRTVRVGAEVCRIPILYQSSGTAMLIWLHSYERTSAAKLFSSFFIVCSSLVELCDSIGNSKIQNLPIIITMKFFKHFYDYLFGACIGVRTQSIHLVIVFAFVSDLNRNIYHAAPFWDKSALAKENCHGKIKNGYLGTDAGADGTGRRRILSEWEKNCAEGNYPNLLHAGKGCIHAGFCHG